MKRKQPGYLVLCLILWINEITIMDSCPGEPPPAMCGAQKTGNIILLLENGVPAK